MPLKTELAKELISCRRRVGGNFRLKEKRRNNIIRVISIDQFSREAGIKYNKAMDEYQYKVRQAVPCRAMYFLYDRYHKERHNGYVLAYGNNGRKWFARKCDANAALLVMINANK